MTLKTYAGGCHCGAVRFEADIDLSQGTVKCNCTNCTKARSWLVMAGADQFRLTAGAACQATYQYTSPGQSAPRVHYHFCPTCGIRTPGRGDMESMGGVFYAVQVSLLDGVDREELAAAPVHFVDGLHDRFDRVPDDIRFL
jgi:hypothetical protein